MTRAYTILAILLVGVLCFIGLVGLAYSGRETETKTPEKPTYDYEIESVDKSECPHDYIRCIQKRGEDGWRLHTVDINLGVAIYEKER